MKKIFLHIGYPKTASTTIQCKLLEPMHNAGLINFLGRRGPVDGHTDEFFPLRNILKNLVYSNGGDFKDNLNKYRDELDKLTLEKIPNVISYETLTFSAVTDLVSCDTHETISRLEELFHKYDVTIIFNVREQSEAIYSNFVEHYNWMYWCCDKKNTYEKFINYNINVKDEDINQYDYSSVYSKLSDVFGDIVVLEFSNFKKNQAKYLYEFSKLFFSDGFSVDEIRNVNSKTLLSTGRLSNKKSMAQIIKNLIPRGWVEYLKCLSQQDSFFGRLLRQLDLFFGRVKVGEAILIESPNENTQSRIKKHFELSNKKFIELTGIKFE